jgi:hypothetical protein
MVVSDAFERLLDQIYRPNLAPDADRGTGRTTLPDERLYSRADTDTSRAKTTAASKTAMGRAR